MMSFSARGHLLFASAITISLGCLASASSTLQGVVVFMPDDMPFLWSESPTDPSKKGARTDWNDYVDLVPNMNRIRDEGVTFTQSYTTAPKCTPSRFGLMTGRFPSRALYAVGSSQQAMATDQSRTIVSVPVTKLDDDDKSTTLASQLRANGNTSTIMAGKWHLQGSTVVNGQTVEASTLWNDYGSATAAVGAAGFTHPAAVYIENMDTTTADTYGWSHNNEWTAAESINAVQASINAEQDFFLYYAPTGPHSPGNEDALDITMTTTPNGSQPSALTSGMKGRDTVKARAGTSNNRDTLVGVIGLDDAFGAVLDSLEAAKVLDNTLVIVTMDHGQIAKDAVYEGGTRTVLMMRLPGVFAERSIVTTPVTNLDIVATILEFKGLLSTTTTTANDELDPALDGISLLTAATNANSEGTGSVGTALAARQCIVNEIEQIRAVVCAGRYKLISKLSAEDGVETAYPASAAVEQMYDLASDPTEQTNLADAARYPEYATITAALREFVVCHDLDTSPSGAFRCDTSVLRPLDVFNNDDDDVSTTTTTIPTTTSTDTETTVTITTKTTTKATSTTTVTDTTTTPTTEKITTTTTPTPTPTPTVTAAATTTTASSVGAKSCIELGWTNVNTNGVCGASQINQECSTAETFATASDICSAAGARLCNLDEVASKVVQNTGGSCNLDQKWVWTSTACGVGKYYKARGIGNRKKRCVLATKSNVAVSCCSDAVVVGIGRRSAVASMSAEPLFAEAGAASEGDRSLATPFIAIGAVVVAIAVVAAAVGILAKRYTSTPFQLTLPTTNAK